MATVIGICTDLVALVCGKQIHARIVIDKMEFDSALASSLINFYGKCGDLDSVNHILHMIEELNDYSLSALIISYANFGRMSDVRRVLNVKDNPSALWNSINLAYL